VFGRGRAEGLIFGELSRPCGNLCTRAAGSNSVLLHIEYALADDRAVSDSNTAHARIALTHGLSVAAFLSSEKKAGRAAGRDRFSTGPSPVFGDSFAYILCPGKGSDSRVSKYKRPARLA